jgi:hypothetical protein
MNKFPGTPRGVIGTAINCKLTELRQKAKKVTNVVDDLDDEQL